MNLLATAGTFVVGPDLAVLLWSAVVLMAAAGGLVAAAKGRWGWLIVGFLLTGGLAWIFTVWLTPSPGSLWARRSRRRAHS